MFRSRWKGMADYKEKAMSNTVEEVLRIGRSGDFELIVVRKRRCCPPTGLAELVERQPKHVELGPIGDLLASSDQGIVSSTLVIQHHGDKAHEEDVLQSKLSNT